MNALSTLHRKHSLLLHEMRAMRQELKAILHWAELDETSAAIGEAIAPLTLDDVRQVFAALGETPSADQIAGTLGMVDSRPIAEGAAATVRELQLEWIEKLRVHVRDEAARLHREAIAAKNGGDAAAKQAEAGRVIALYPLSEKPEVLEEAKRLSAAQMGLSARLETLRRQRYNRWAVDQIEAAVDFYNHNVSRFNPFADNVVLIDKLVQLLGPVDPAALEPVALDLYNYIIERTKGSLSELNKLQLAKRLSDPAIQRKTMGDF